MNEKELGYVNLQTNSQNLSFTYVHKNCTSNPKRNAII